MSETSASEALTQNLGRVEAAFLGPDWEIAGAVAMSATKGRRKSVSRRRELGDLSVLANGAA
jgi:hypothetical protein